MTSGAFDLAIYEELKSIRKALQDIAKMMKEDRTPVSVHLYDHEPLRPETR